jgi:hypothetical protein
VRAGRAAEALPLWAEIVADPRSTSEDRMNTPMR